jgi:signal transduction histidine kinase
MYLTYFILAPDYEVQPLIKKSLIDETHAITSRISQSLAQPGSSLEVTIKQIHAEEDANIRVFDLQGKELAACMEQRLTHTKKISPEIIAQTLHNGEHLQLIFPRWMHVVSVILKKNNTPFGIVQIYYTLTEGSILPRGIPTVIMVIIFGGITVVLTRILTRPIRELIGGVRQMAAGNLGVRVKVRSRDELGELGNAFNDMSQRLDEFYKLRTELLADISHEIRSPLARIQTTAELLIDKRMGKEERQEYLQAICDEVTDLDHLINDLSILSRLDAHEIVMECAPASLDAVLSQECVKFALQMEDKGIALDKNIAPNLPLAPIDQKRIGQVITNLLTNALRYTPAGGTIEVGAQRQGSMIEVWVQDTGPGIPQKDLPHIFDRFYRVDKSRSRETGGTGLGLAIAKKFVEAHGGSIRAESASGKGTRIVFTLSL